jgi:type I restriction enzyme M protein
VNSQKTAKRIGIDPTKLAHNKKTEAANIAKNFTAYMQGKHGKYCVPASRISDRMDVKFCLADGGRKAKLWKSKSLTVCKVQDVLAPATKRDAAVVESDQYQFLRVNYDGDVIDGDLIDGAECSYSTLYKVEAWDILMSNMGVGRGAVGIVPPFHAGKYVSNEYTILRAASEEEAVYYCNLLRTKEILGDILASTTGMNRGRIKWDSVCSVLVPQYVSGNASIKTITADLKKYWSAYSSYSDGRKKHMAAVSTDLDVDGADSHHRWLAYMPPE